MDRAELTQLLGGEPRLAEPAAEPIVIEEREPARFIDAFTDAVAGGGPIFLADPTWGVAQRAELANLLQTQIASRQSADSRGWLMIPSGGTGGKLKFARHDEETIGAAVRGFCAHFGFERVNAVGVLPLYHVSGFMAWMRCAMTGGDFVPCDWKGSGLLETPILRDDNWVISLVPTQLQRLLASASAVEWLRQFRVIFVSGGPVWPTLADEAARARLPVSLCYGMTETAAMVAALRPEEFLAGDRSSGRAMPHARINVNAEGVIRVEGESVFRGYWPETRDGREFTTEDLGSIDEEGHLHVLGRRDAMIITGGKKVQPAEVEAALRASGEFADVAVIGVPDPEWGEAVVACYPKEERERVPDVARAAHALAAHQKPKRYVAISPADWPRNPQGKIDRVALRDLISRGAARERRDELD